MNAPSPGFPFRWLLPMIQLLVCMVMLQPYWFRFRSQVTRETKTYWQSLLGVSEAHPQPAMLLNITPEEPAQPVDPRLTTPAALNLPVGFAQLPFVLLSQDRAEWTPEGMLLPEWRALSWPFAGILIWWLVGRGLEAFLAAARSRRFAIIRPPLHNVEVAIGLAVLVAGSALSMLYLVGRNPSGLVTDPLLAAGAGFWAVLGATMVFARVLQWRIRRRARMDGIAYVP